MIGCSLVLNLRRIYQLDHKYGKAVAYEALVYIIANIIAGGFNLWLANHPERVILLIGVESDRGEVGVEYDVVVIAYVMLTEVVPAVALVTTLNVFDTVISEEGGVGVGGEREEAMLG